MHSPNQIWAKNIYYVMHFMFFNESIHYSLKALIYIKLYEKYCEELCNIRNTCTHFFKKILSTNIKIFCVQKALIGTFHADFSLWIHKTNYKGDFVIKKRFLVLYLKISGIQEWIDSDLVRRIQLISIKGWKFPAHTTQILTFDNN